tara:strand:+ start:51 stop:371 length:321 start_codon:yes stop_codon:yes gene_type:complete
MNPNIHTQRMAEKLLGLDKVNTYNNRDVNKCYKKLMKKHHPDLKHGSISKAVNLNQARYILLNNDKELVTTQEILRRHNFFTPFDSLNDELEMWSNLDNLDAYFNK